MLLNLFLNPCCELAKKSIASLLLAGCSGDSGGDNQLECLSTMIKLNSNRKSPPSLAGPFSLLLGPPGLEPGTKGL